MALSQETILTRVRNRTGLSPNDRSDAVIQDDALAALVEYSKFKPAEVYGLLPTLSGVQDYNLPDGKTNYQNWILPDGVTEYSTPAVNNIRDLLYSSGITATYPFFDKDFPLTVVQDLFNVQFGGNVFESPSLARVLFDKLQQFRDVFGVDFQVIQGTTKFLRIFPSPTQDGIAAFYGTARWTDLSTLPAEDEEAFVKAVLWKTAEGRAGQLAVMKQMSQSGGMNFQPAFDYWDKKSQCWKDEFLGDIGASAMPIVVG